MIQAAIPHLSPPRSCMKSCACWHGASSKGPAIGERLSADSAGCSLGRFSHWWRSVWVSVFGERGFHTSVALASTVLLGCQKHRSCTLGQLTSPRSESVFFASFLCRFGQRNDGRIQPVDATPITSASLSAGVIKSRVLRGLPFRSAATLFNSACE